MKKTLLIAMFCALPFSTVMAEDLEMEYSSQCSCEVDRDYIFKTQDNVSGTAMAPNLALASSRTKYQIKIKCLNNLDMTADVKAIEQVLLYDCSRPALAE